MISSKSQLLNLGIEYIYHNSFIPNNKSNKDINHSQSWNLSNLSRAREWKEEDIFNLLSLEVKESISYDFIYKAL